MFSPRELIDGYLDDVLTAEQQVELSEWIRSDPEHAKTFAQASLLHDRLRSVMAVRAETLNETKPMSSIRAGGRIPTMSVLSTAASVAILCLGLGALWFSYGQTTASAAISELNRIIVNNTASKDRTYVIVVEEVVVPAPRGNRPPSMESQRPPKPPLDGAILHVRDSDRFVLMRTNLDGLPFVTGSNGQQSWAIKGRGPIKVSRDVHYFDHDLPGHETSIPLTNIHEGLGKLRQAYHLQFSSLGPEEFELQEGETVRMLVAVKKPKERGPQRVEIAYESKSGRILHMRFVQMPYGPDRLDLRLSLMNENELPADFFEHASHHTPNRKVETEN